MARGMLIWVLLMLVETVHGVLRGLWLTPRIGADNAGLIGWPVAALLVLAITLLTIRWTRLSTRRGLLQLGALWAMLTVLFELAIGALRGLPVTDLIAAVNPLTGSVLWSAALMLAAPLVAARLRGLARS